jgi:hypothetical protein
MERLTDAEVAAIAGVSTHRVAELANLGLLVASDDGSYPRAAVETVRIAEALERPVELRGITRPVTLYRAQRRASPNFVTGEASHGQKGLYTGGRVE